MNVKEVLEIALTVIGSLGGGGLIVFGLSGYLGKLWADRALERQRHEYAQLNIGLTHQLDLVTRRVQVELDALGHLQKLRTESEFQIASELWKRIAVLRDSLGFLPKKGFSIRLADQKTQHEIVFRTNGLFIQHLREAYELLNQEALSIPKDIVDAARELIRIAHLEQSNVLLYPDPFDPSMKETCPAEERALVLDERSKHLEEFEAKADKLEAMMRKHREEKP